MKIESFVRVRPEIYDVGNDLKHKFPEGFRDYVKRENLSCLEYRRIGLEIYDVGTDFYVFEKAQTLPESFFLSLRSRINTDHFHVHSECQSLVKRLISFFKRDHFRAWNLLVQFWAAEEVVNSVGDTNYRLTTRSLPFLLGNIRSWNPEHEGLCRYRMKMCNVSVAGDGGGGAIGRVFRNQRKEYIPNVGYYTSEVYSLRDVALSCHIKHSVVVPWFDSYRKVVGVIEFVSSQNPNCFAEVLKYFNEYLSSKLKMTIEATYGDRLIRFQLSPSSGIHELSHQLSQRLGLVDETYDLKYPDEQNDHIELLCDEDLQLYISESVNNEIFTLKVLIVPK